MSSKIQRNVSPLVMLAALSLLPVVSHAEDGGGDYNFPASNVMREPEARSGSLSCAEATKAAWFNRQVEISDGDVSPSINMPAECDRKLVAQAGGEESK
jgi:hypothetical protein